MVSLEEPISASRVLKKDKEHSVGVRSSFSSKEEYQVSILTEYLTIIADTNLTLLET